MHFDLLGVKLWSSAEFGKLMTKTHSYSNATLATSFSFKKGFCWQQDYFLRKTLNKMTNALWMFTQLQEKSTTIIQTGLLQEWIELKSWNLARIKSSIRSSTYSCSGENLVSSVGFLLIWSWPCALEHLVCMYAIKRCTVNSCHAVSVTYAPVLPDMTTEVGSKILMSSTRPQS